MRIRTKLIGGDDDGRKTLMMLGIVIHHGLNATCVEYTIRASGLPAQHQDDRQGRLGFGWDQCRRRQVNKRLTCLETGCGRRNIHFVDRTMGWYVADGVVSDALPPLRDGDEVPAVGHAGQIGFMIGVHTEQRT